MKNYGDEQVQTSSRDRPQVKNQTSLEMRTPTEFRLTLGIVTYNNSPRQLRRLARSIEYANDQLHSLSMAANILTIDCGEVSEWPALTVPLRRLPFQGNLGFGKGTNVLLREAFSVKSCDWFLCVNPDGLLHQALLKALIWNSLDWPNSLIEARQFPEEHPKPYDPESGLTPWASGACLLIPRRIYEVVGGFDPHFFMYEEDVDFSWRARAAGFSIRVAPNALFSHPVLNRTHSRVVEGYCLASARYLAHKWRRTDIQKSCEETLCQQGFVSRKHLSRFPRGLRVSRALAALANFSIGRAPLRWGGYGIGRAICGGKSGSRV
jgi:GT2 family glycosyltransferase